MLPSVVSTIVVLLSWVDLSVQSKLYYLLTRSILLQTGFPALHCLFAICNPLVVLTCTLSVGPCRALSFLSPQWQPPDCECFRHSGRIHIDAAGSHQGATMQITLYLYLCRWILIISPCHQSLGIDADRIHWQRIAIVIGGGVELSCEVQLSRAKPCKSTRHAAWPRMEEEWMIEPVCSYLFI